MSATPINKSGTRARTSKVWRARRAPRFKTKVTRAEGTDPPYVWRVDNSQYAGVWALQVVLITAASNVAR
ncbi:unnamed protein product, partial [Brenthis ino]